MLREKKETYRLFSFPYFHCWFILFEFMTPVWINFLIFVTFRWWCTSMSIDGNIIWTQQRTTNHAIVTTCISFGDTNYHQSMICSFDIFIGPVKNTQTWVISQGMLLVVVVLPEHYFVSTLFFGIVVPCNCLFF